MKRPQTIELSVGETPTDGQMKELARILEREYRQKKLTQRYASVKEVLILLGKGVLLTSILLAPGMAKAYRKRPFLSTVSSEWKQFNQGYLRRTVKRLERQRIVEMEEKEGQTFIAITERGKRKILKYALDTLTIQKPLVWDRKWRIVMYDIPKKRMKFLQIQKSVYLTPYPCENEIEFIRSYLGVAENTKLLTVGMLEHQETYREYFGL